MYIVSKVFRTKKSDDIPDNKKFLLAVFRHYSAWMKSRNSNWALTPEELQEKFLGVAEQMKKDNELIMVRGISSEEDGDLILQHILLCPTEAEYILYSARCSLNVDAGDDNPNLEEYGITFKLKTEKVR